MERLREKFYQKISNTELLIVREFRHNIDWTNRLIGITGSRGCGKFRGGSFSTQHSETERKNQHHQELNHTLSASA